jgi:hypothetical protein
MRIVNYTVKSAVLTPITIPKSITKAIIRVWNSKVALRLEDDNTKPKFTFTPGQVATLTITPDYRLYFEGIDGDAYIEIIYA